MPDEPNWLLYGATGYTGRLIAAEAARRGMRPLLAGRSREKLAALGDQLGLPMRVFGLDDPPALAAAIHDVRAVLHCAGPFSRTSRPMIEACLSAGCHYLDITGEIDVIEHAAAQHARAQGAGVTVMPAVGFDVVPSDCLARTLSEALPGATQLCLAFMSGGGVSPGTAKTMLESLPQGARERRAGRIVAVPRRDRRREIPFRTGTRTAWALSWGDVASAYYTTGIPNIVTYAALGRAESQQMKWLGLFGPLLRFPPLLRWLQQQIERRIEGPAPDELLASRSSLWGEVRDATGRIASCTLDTPGGYQLTPLTALECLSQLLAGRASSGFATPAGGLGKDLILRIPGTARSPCVVTQD